MYNYFDLPKGEVVLFINHKKDEITYYTSNLLDNYGISHFFASKNGGVSKGCFESLNVSTARKDENGLCDKKENVYENIRRALSVINSLPRNSICTKQVHKANVFVPNDTYAGFGTSIDLPEVEDCDAVFIPSKLPFPDTACVKTADCVPILIADKITGNVCAVHAGWRGTVCDIVTRAIKTMDACPENILCAIGPCIKSCCYSVGKEVYDSTLELFSKKGLTDRISKVFTQKGSKLYADLALINFYLLQSCSIPSQNIDICDMCTCCTKDSCGQNIFFSHRAMNCHSGTFLSGIKTFTPFKEEMR